MNVSIIILNYNGAQFLSALFESLSVQTFTDFEIVFVDNNSTDNSLQLLDELFVRENLKKMRLKIVKNYKNFGYCAGNNIGVKYAIGKYLVFLNNDTYVSKSWLKELVTAMDTFPSIGAFQSRLIDIRTGEVQMDGRLLDLFGWSRSFKLNHPDSQISKIPFYTSGASFIIGRRTLLEIGGFDAEVFSGDSDLCWRLRLIGYDVAVALWSICYHYGSVSTKMLVTSVKIDYNHYCEILRIILKNYSLKNIVKRLPQSIIFILFEATYISIKEKNPFNLASFHKALTWNIKRIKDTLAARDKIQKLRTVDDREIVKKMSNYSIVLTRRTGCEIL